MRKTYAKSISYASYIKDCVVEDQERKQLQGGKIGWDVLIDLAIPLLDKFSVIAPVGVFSCRANAFEPFAEPPGPPPFVLFNVLLRNRLRIANGIGKVVHSRQFENIEADQGGFFHALSRRGHPVAEKKTNLLVTHHPHKILGQSIIDDRHTAWIERHPLQKQPHARRVVRPIDRQEGLPARGEEHHPIRMRVDHTHDLRPGLVNDKMHVGFIRSVETRVCLQYFSVETDGDDVSFSSELQRLLVRTFRFDQHLISPRYPGADMAERTLGDALVPYHPAR